MKIALDIRHTADDQASDMGQKQAARALGKTGPSMSAPHWPSERRMMVDHHPEVGLFATELGPTTKAEAALEQRRGWSCMDLAPGQLEREPDRRAGRKER